ncbi:SO2930 family diheme c-type cytochrome [Vibrio sp. SCSIO 43136]|uniref:SO2930 family diheme c-type cytochrome n=1 Tax=Vibrio sp. SCSIO 43136 TaxID=2819101 RepID=UPI00207653D4|nr:SO2930 family diheme c-type cytochrome [Vibrio sp. SCSIO 43136]USD66069.1 hypothetical protein J4N39_04395 [Vibrio sp. SCSIO 43136]
MKHLPHYLAISMSVIALAGCNGGSESSSSDSSSANVTPTELERPILPTLDPTNPNPNNSNCNLVMSSGEVNWAAINNDVEFKDNCEKLSDYNFFADATNPTTGLNTANANGTLYTMQTQLFTDYASKYRFVVMPQGSSADYMQNETFIFPVGTVLIKSFALPKDTATRGITNEELIETRLLIKRTSGWIALPYVWNEDYSDAQLTAAPINLDRTITHDGATMSFAYGVPGRDQCTTCHNINKDITDPTGKVQAAGFAPIGPKARSLNSGHTYGSTTQNQLEYWSDNGLLINLPTNMALVQDVPVFDGTEGVVTTNLTATEIEDYAKAYLDINCAHCHRDEGKASSTGLYLPDWLAYTGNEETHGRCRTSLTSTKASTTIDLWPGDADKSLIHYRMSITDGEKMPELGRDLVHSEGLALVKTWINQLPYQDCSK